MLAWEANALPLGNTRDVALFYPKSMIWGIINE
jgi:hypothetical protein